MQNDRLLDFLDRDLLNRNRNDVRRVAGNIFALL
jgi:hypothetical protein